MSIHYKQPYQHPTPSSYRAPSTPMQTFQQLKSGKMPILKTFHLRGMTQEEAMTVATTALASTHKQSLYLLIHGKGKQSDNNYPVLKSMLLDFLYKHPQVNAYCQALPKDGGQGALYLLATSR